MSDQQEKQLKAPVVKAETQAVGTYDRKPSYRPKPLALMIHRAIIQMRGSV